MSSASPPRLASGAEMDLLCACASPVFAAKTADFFRRGDSVSWPRFLALATNHHVLPLVHRALKAVPSGGPAEWRDRLRVCQTAIAAYNLRATATLRRLQARLAADGIQLVPVKGPALALLAYGDVALRQFEDLDLIVRRADLLRAVAALEGEGFRLRELAPGVDRARYLKTLQNWSLAKPGFPPLDLKPVLISHALCGPASADFMGTACCRIPGDAASGLSAPGPAEMLLAVCLDGANEMWFKLSAVADVGALIAEYADVDWARFLAEAMRLGQRRSLLVGAGLAEELLGVELPAAFRLGLAGDPVARRLARHVAARLRSEAPRQDIVFRQSVFALRTRERFRDRWRFIRRLLFVPGAYEFTRWAWPRALWPAYALARPFRLLWTVAARGGRSCRLTVPPADARLASGGNQP
ncbi:MAG: nucleotidyltransferase family protein [Kiritimatiellia bacterium]